MVMLLDQRRDEILQLIEKQGFGIVAGAGGTAGGHRIHVRRDLEYLDGISQIRRTRGGAAYIGDHLTPFEERGTTALPKTADRRVGRREIQPGETVLLGRGHYDAGSWPVASPRSPCKW